MTRVIRADRSGPAIVPAAVAEAKTQARAILERALALDETRKAEALAAARVQARAELAADLVRLAHARAEQLARLEPEAIKLALAAARRIIGAELAISPERLTAMVAPLLARVRLARQVTLRVHPDDLGLLQPQLGALRAGAELDGSLQLEPDPALTRGDCVVQSDVGVLDARIETQLHALARALGAE